MVKLLGLDPIAMEPDSHIAHGIGEIAVDVAQLNHVRHRRCPKGASENFTCERLRAMI